MVRQIHPPGPPVLVPCVRLGLGTESAAVRDCRKRTTAHLANPELVLSGGAVCAKGVTVTEDQGDVLVRFRGGEMAWVRPGPESDSSADAA